jgi:hypothetical protein
MATITEWIPGDAKTESVHRLEGRTKLLGRTLVTVNGKWR